MNSNNKIGFGLLLLFLGIAIFFLFRPFAYAIAIAAIITIGIVSIWYLITGLSRWIRKFRLRNTIEGILEEKLENTEALEYKLNADLELVEKELADVENRLLDKSLSDFARDKLISLKEAFVEERDLKSVKLQFYRDTAVRFKALLSDHEVLKSISVKKEKLSKSNLKRVPEDHNNDDILSQDKEVIEDLDFLLHRMKNTEQILEAQDIRKELVELYR